MEIEIMTLCDAATESGGKLNILGAFDTIFSKKFPVAHPQCSVVLRLRYMAIETGPHRVRIGIVDADGRSVLPTFDVNVNVKCAPPEESVVANLILNIQALKFEKEGRYSIDLAVDGRHERSLPLNVKSGAASKPNLN